MLLVAVALAFLEETAGCGLVVGGWAVVEQVVGRIGQAGVEGDKPQAGAGLDRCCRRHRQPVGGVAHQIEHLTVGLEAQALGAPRR
ncbi:MAG: hypothetical protein V9F00_09925 [Nocardioides sp.]